MKNRVYNTRAVIEAGLIIALVVVIMLINVYVPVFSLFGMFVLPIPITVLYIRHDYKITLGAVVVSAVLIAMLYDPLSALTSSITFGFTGLTLGYCIKRDKKAGTTILLLAIVLAIATVIDFAIYINLIDRRGIVAFINDNIKIMKDSLNMTKELYSKIGVSSEQLAPIDQAFSVFNTDSILRLIPAILIMTSFMSAYINYAITRSILKRLRYNVNEIKPFNQIYINTRIGTLVGLALLIGVLLNRNNIAAGTYVLTSAEIILQFIFTIDGLALATYFLRNKFKLAKGIVSLILVFTVFSQLSLIYVYVGLIDMIFDFRKLDPYRRPRAK